MQRSCNICSRFPKVSRVFLIPFSLSRSNTAFNVKVISTVAACWSFPSWIYKLRFYLPARCSLVGTLSILPVSPTYCSCTEFGEHHPFGLSPYLSRPRRSPHHTIQPYNQFRRSTCLVLLPSVFIIQYNIVIKFCMQCRTVRLLSPSFVLSDSLERVRLTHNFQFVQCSVQFENSVFSPHSNCVLRLLRSISL